MLKRPRLCPTIPTVAPVRIEHNKFCSGEFPPFVYFQTIFPKRLRLFREIRGFTPGKLLFDLRHELKQKREYNLERKAKSRQLRKTLHQNQWFVCSFVNKFPDFPKILPTSLIRKWIRVSDDWIRVKKVQIGTTMTDFHVNFSSKGQRWPSEGHRWLI